MSCDRQCPVFSVIIPTYNVEEYIEETLKSVYRQSFKNFEIIVVDDGSSDKTRNILQQQNSRLRVVYQTNSGVSCARNRGIQMAQGMYIALLDGDDVWNVHHLKLAYDFFGRHPEILWYSGCYKIFSQFEEIEHELFADLVALRENTVNYYETGWQVIHTSSVVLHRSLLSKWDPLFPPGVAMGEDVIAWSRLASVCPLLGHAQQVTSFYRQRANSAVSMRRSFIEQKVCREEQFQTLLQVEPQDLAQAALAKQYYRHIFIGILSHEMYIPQRKWREFLKEQRPVCGNFIYYWYLCYLYISQCCAFLFSLPLRASISSFRRTKNQPVYQPGAHT